MTAADCTTSIITPASVACLADPLPPLAWMQLQPSVTTPTSRRSFGMNHIPETSCDKPGVVTEGSRPPPRSGPKLRWDSPPVSFSLVSRPLQPAACTYGICEHSLAHDAKIAIRDCHRRPSDILNRGQVRQLSLKDRRRDATSIGDVPIGNDQHYLCLRHAQFLVRHHTVREQSLSHDLVERFVEPRIQGNPITECRRCHIPLPVPASPGPPPSDRAPCRSRAVRFRVLPLQQIGSATDTGLRHHKGVDAGRELAARRVRLALQGVTQSDPLELDGRRCARRRILNPARCP